MASMKKVGERDGEGVYRLRWRVEGRLVEKWVRGHEAAKAAKAELERDAVDGFARDPRAGARVLNDYFEAWLSSRLVKGRPLRQSTRDGYERLWARTVAPTIGRRKLNGIRPELVREWHGELASHAGQDQGAKAYRLLHAVFATAEADELVRANPCRIKGAGQEHHDERPLVKLADVLDLADAIGERYRALVLVVGFGSLRTGEALGLRRVDVDLLHREIHVRGQAQELRGGRRELDHAKNDAGRRSVTIPAAVAAALEEHLEAFTGPESDASVFTGPNGRPLLRRELSDAWKAAKRATGVPENLRLYDLRHHGATLTARKPGVTTKELMARIGHSSWKAALIYQHAAAERDREVADFMDDEIASATRTRKAPVVGLGPGTRGAGVGRSNEGQDAAAS